jgi:hypothetical protein
MAMLQRRALQGIGIGVVGLALAFAPLSAASASSHKSKHHKSSHHSTSKKSSKSTPSAATTCKDLKVEQTGSSSIGSAIASAVESGNYATAKAAMLNAFNLDLKNADTALSVLHSAPANVQAALKGLFAAVGTIKTDIENSTSFAGLESSFASLGENPQLKTDGTIVANYFGAKCGTVTPTTTAP